MKQMFAALVLASVSALVACGGGKKPDTTPVHSPEAGGATGGAAYGGHKAPPPTPTPSASANPCAGK